MNSPILFDPFLIDHVGLEATAEQLRLEAEADIARAIEIGVRAFEEAAAITVENARPMALTGPGGFLNDSHVEQARAAAARLCAVPRK